MKASTIFLLILLPNIFLFGQKFGKIDKKDLAQVEHPQHQDAEVSYLVKNTKCYYKLNRKNYVMVSEHFNRIKIYKKEGLDIADQTIYLYVGDKDAEKINGLKAEVFNIENGKVTKTKLDKKDIFKEKSESYELVKFALPNVQPGSIIDIKYKIVSPFLYSFPKHFFQTKYPVESSNYTVIIPEYFDMTPVATGFIPLNRSESVTFATGQKETEYNFSASSIPPLKEDDYVLNINDYRSSLKYELDKISFPG